MSKLVCLVLSISLVIGRLDCSVSGRKARYDNYHVYQVEANTHAALKELKSIEDHSDSVIFLQDLHRLNKKVTVIVAPHKVPDFEEFLAESDVSFELSGVNAQSIIDAEDQDRARHKSGKFNWNEYQTLDDINKWLESLPEKHPEVTVIEGGESSEGRDLKGVRISFGPGRPAVLLEAGIHAREWIGPATATFLINEILENSSKRRISRDIDWVIFPSVNPDGYVYSHTKNRFWRKTRSKGKFMCRGADANRNFDSEWNTIGASSNPCSDTYAGSKAFSEIEARSLAEYIGNFDQQILVYISLHSFSQLLLHPYGHTKTPVDNIDDYNRVSEAAVKAMAKRSGTQYTSGGIYTTIYPVSGGSIDWVYANNFTKYSYCYELRPDSSNGLSGFQLPANQIIPTGLETTDSILAMIKEIKKLENFN